MAPPSAWRWFEQGPDRLRLELEPGLSVSPSWTLRNRFKNGSQSVLPKNRWKNPKQLEDRARQLQPEPVEKPPHASVGPETAPKKESSTSIPGTTKQSPPERTIYFDQDSNELLKNEVLKLDKIAETLIRQPDLKVSLNGYSDASGSTDYNRMISESRASSVKMYLVGKGVDPLRISVVGHGMKDFAASNASEEGQRLNRRVEITIGGK